MNFKLKRILAFLIDMVIVSALITMLININFLNPKREEYNRTLNEYKEYAKELYDKVGNEVNNPSDIITPEYKEYLFKLNKLNISGLIIDISVVILYFTLFPMFNRDQTIGKRLCKIKVSNLNNNERVPLYKHFLRSFVLPISAGIMLLSVTSDIFSLIYVFCLNPSNYYIFSSWTTIIICILCYADAIYMLANKDGLSLHDKILKTKVEEYK